MEEEMGSCREKGILTSVRSGLRTGATEII